MYRILLIILLANTANAQGRPNFTRPIDPNVNTFATAAGLTNASDRGFAYVIVTDMKMNAFWSGLTFMHLYLGGTSSSCSPNAKTPGTYDLSPVGSPTFASTGMTTNGTTQYANTNCAINVLSQNDNHISIYGRTSVSGQANGLMGGLDGSNFGTYIVSHWTNGSAYFQNNSGGYKEKQATSNGTSLFTSTRTGSSDFADYRSAVSYHTTTSGTLSSSTPIAINILIQARNDNGTPNYGQGEVNFDSGGTGRTAAQETLYYNIILRFNTLQARN